MQEQTARFEQAHCNSVDVNVADDKAAIGSDRPDRTKGGSIEQPSIEGMSTIQRAGFVGAILCPFVGLAILAFGITANPTLALLVVLAINLVAIGLSR
jgi:hypothetical protein